MNGDVLLNGTRTGATATATAAEQANILIVDDLPENLVVCESILSALGENLVMVTSGAQALRQVLERPFAVILLDVNMPDMDGFETARLLRKHRRSSATPIVFLTAFADEVLTAEAYASGAVDYLPTPIVPEILRAKVRIFVELYKMRRQMEHRAEERARLTVTEEANRRLMFLADSGALLGRSLDFATTAQDVVRLPLPFLSQTSLLTFAPGVVAGGKPLFAELQSGPEVSMTELNSLDEAPPDVRAAAARALATGSRIQSEDATVLSIPLQARSRTFAALTMGRAQGYSASEIALATVLASRAATALDNALLHEELQKADRQKVDFLSMLAHELRNPLAPISNAVQLLRLQTADDTKLQWSSDVIDRQVGQLVRLVDDLLDVSRITSGKIRLQRQTIDLTDAVNHAVEASQPLIQERNHRLSVVLPARSVWIDGDKARIMQVITNLLNNAAKYTEDGGQIQVALRMEGSSASVSVRDSGLGIPPDLLQSVFDLFTQVDQSLDRSSGGLGIGLTLVRRLVEMHGGTVSAESPGVGRGSTFTVRLPTCSAPATERRETAAPQLVARPNGAWLPRVLIVDDNADAADTLASLLRLTGHPVQVAYDGRAGLKLAQEFEPDAVLLDIGLPELDGYTVAARLREAEATQNALLIAVTGYGQPKDEERSRQAGIDLHLVKPIEFHSLRPLLQSGRWPHATATHRVECSALTAVASP
jgi:signal transduction histidine kinase/DNA-binding response OmpR family regulator